jgi:predicted HicB family RNase H-like nuclease
MRGRKPGTPSPIKGKKFKPPSTTMTVRLPVELLSALREIAKLKGVTLNRLIVTELQAALQVKP